MTRESNRAVWRPYCRIPSCSGEHSLCSIQAINRSGKTASTMGLHLLYPLRGRFFLVTEIPGGISDGESEPCCSDKFKHRVNLNNSYLKAKNVYVEGLANETFTSPQQRHRPLSVIGSPFHGPLEASSLLFCRSHCSISVSLPWSSESLLTE